ncbi:UNVERIFIED_CONTAM: BTB/POZ domain-containing protein [Sesamum radiatum]|uniref:BTB/POZ domain-containing protein n=1 Tax=Sesamum radiatum TaxID=300843 RepID=A0AAW2KLY6_SESRA
MSERIMTTAMSELDEIELEAEDFHSSLPLKKVPYGDVLRPPAPATSTVSAIYWTLASTLTLVTNGTPSPSTTRASLAISMLLACFSRVAPFAPSIPSTATDVTTLPSISRLEVAVDDMEDLLRICRVCKCHSLQSLLEKELVHQRHAEYKALRDIDNSQKRFILQGLSLPEEDRLPAALNRVLQISLANSSEDRAWRIMSDSEDDLADVCVRVEKKIFRCHQVVLASRSEYFKARLSRMKDFLEERDCLPDYTLPCLEEHDLSAEAFQKMIEYM